MSAVSRDSMLIAMDLVRKYDEEKAEEVLSKEDLADTYEDKLGSYLVKLSSKSLTIHDSREISKLLHCIVDFERISDHAVSIMRIAHEMSEKKVVFSDDAMRELDVMQHAVKDICTLTEEAFSSSNMAIAIKIEPLEQVVDYLKAQLKNRHIERLRQGHCTLEMGLMFSDIITHYERVGDHCSNIGACLIQVAQGSYDTHEYLHSIKRLNNSRFTELVEEAKSHYPLPEDQQKAVS